MTVNTTGESPVLTPRWDTRVDIPQNLSLSTHESFSSCGLLRPAGGFRLILLIERRETPQGLRLTRSTSTFVNVTPSSCCAWSRRGPCASMPRQSAASSCCACSRRAPCASMRRQVRHIMRSNRHRPPDFEETGENFKFEKKPLFGNVFPYHLRWIILRTCRNFI